VTNPKLQAPTHSQPPTPIGVGFWIGNWFGIGNWESLGIWSLELGI
jgi:hypothetical protein